MEKESKRRREAAAESVLGEGVSPGGVDKVRRAHKGKVVRGELG